jgi:DNA-directed RNA polymerase beta subunit
VWASCALGAAVLSCAGPQPPSTPVAEVIDVPHGWSYCDPGERVNLSRENADVIESDALRMRTRSPYDVIVVPGYTPDDAKKPMPEVHPVAASRLDEAIALYKEGKASLLLVTGGAVRPEGTPYAEALVMKRYLLEHGISEAAIVVEPCARHSTTNLRNAGRFMLKYHLRRLNARIPNLHRHPEVEYDKFLQMKERQPPTRARRGRSPGGLPQVFPIKDFNGTSELVFVSYNLEKPKYDVDECRQRGMTFAAPIKVTTQLMIYDTRDGGERIVRDIKEQEVYFGEIPLMTDTGTFIINGTERVVVSQLHRSPGVFFDHDKGKTHSSGKLLYSARVIPYRGSWLDFEFDPKDIIYVRIDRRRKMHATVLLRALGYTTQDLLNYFYSTETVFLEKGGKYAKSIEYELSRASARRATSRSAARSSSRRTPSSPRPRSEAEGRQARPSPVEPEELTGKVAAHDVVDPETGEVSSRSTRSSREKLERLARPASTSFRSSSSTASTSAATCATRCSPTRSRRTEDAILEIYRRLRPGDPPTLETAKTLFHNLFFNPERYDLSKVGRLKLNYKFYRDLPEEQRPASTRRCSRRRTSSRRCATSSSSRTVAARSTTSTTSATAASARSAS